MQLPGTTTRVIADLIPDMIDALQGRTDVTNTVAARYIRRALQEITISYPFEELRTTGPTVSLTPNQSIYNATTFLNNGDDYSSNEVFVLYIDLPANTVTYTLDYMTPKALEVIISPVTQGPPSKWTRYGRNIHLGPTPDKAYSIFMRYQIRHPFPDDINALPGAPIFIPDDWEEIVSYAAAERLAIVKRWNDQAKTLHDLLYGDPEAIASEGKRGRPGLIAARLMQVERDQQFNTRKLGIHQPRYSSR